MDVLLQVVNVVLKEGNQQLYSLILETYFYRIIFFIACGIVSVFIYFLLSLKLLKDINRKELICGIALLVFINSIIFATSFLMLNFFGGAYSNQGVLFHNILVTFNSGIGGWIDLSWEVISGIGAYFAVYLSTFIPISVMVFTWLRKEKIHII